MRKTVLTIIGIFSAVLMSAQCNTTNATTCQCDSITTTNCDLLPDITISWYALQNYAGGPNEFSQTGNGVDNGRLKVTGSTPNIGHGSLTVRGVNDQGLREFICGTDTFMAPATGTFVCPNGNPMPQQMVWQRIYNKNGNTMTYWDREALPMTYHPTHSHIHNDEWGIFTLRIQDPLEPDPRNWSIVGTGHKLGFCLMDYYQCSDPSANNHCKDDNTIYNQGTTLYNSDFPNWQLGGGSYGCSATEQGISSGYTDVYSESLDGMWINIPPGTCNGNYWIVYEVDPRNAFLEEDESNNYTAIPFTLTQQSPSGSPVVKITASESPNLCTGDSVKLTATAGTSYLWNTGATTQSIWATPGTYSVTVTNYCGTATSTPFVVSSSATPAPPVCVNDTICSGMPATFTASGNNLLWMDSLGNNVGTGSSFTTPNLTANATYWVEDQAVYTGSTNYIGKTDSIGAGGYSNSANYTMFDVFRPLTIKSVEVYANGPGNRTIQLMDEIGIVLDARTIYVANGPSRIDLNFDVDPGKNYSMRIMGTTNLWRNTGGVSYPYTMQDTLSLTTSSAGGNNYYFFYDWEVEVGGAKCSSPAVPVTAVVQICNSVHGLDLSGNYNVYPNPSDGNFKLDLWMPAETDIEYNIYDVSGRQILNKKLERINGKYTETLVLDRSPGIYIMQLVIDGKSYYHKLIIQ